ncbi:hypothetical protein [Geodermatophilus sp. SYSU D00079]
MIRNTEVGRACQWARRADVAPHLAAVLSPDGRGARSRLTVETALAGMLLTSWHAPAMTYENIHRVLTRQIRFEMQWELGVRYRDKQGVERTITRRPIENMVNQIGDRLGFLSGSHPVLDDADRAQRGELLQSVIDRTSTRWPGWSMSVTRSPTPTWLSGAFCGRHRATIRRARCRSSSGYRPRAIRSSS